MRLSPLLAAFFLLSTAVRATDVPRLDNIKIDGALDDWASRGFSIENLASPDGEPVASSDFYARAHVGWDALGFLAAVEVTDNVLTETPDALYSGDSIELFLARSVGDTDRVQIILSPGLNPAGDGPRVFYADNRRQKNTPLVAEFARSVTAHGYILEVRIPWAALGWKPEGTFGFQIIANDADAGPVHTKWSWHPGQQSSSDPRQVNPVHLAETASPADPIFWRWRPSLAGDRVTVTVASTQTVAAGQLVTARENGVVVAQTSLVTGPSGARTEFILRTHGEDIALALGDRPLGVIPLKTAPETANSRPPRLDYTLSPAVFSSSTFPAPKLVKAADIEKALGPVTLTVRYFDSAQNEVKTAEKPGRYGVIYDIKPANAPAIRRYQTLFRTPQEINWRTAEIDFDRISLPAGLGLDPDTARVYHKNLGEVFADAWHANFTDSSENSIVLAGIYETPPGCGPVTGRNDAWRRDQDWWYSLRKKTGDWRQYDHLVQTPPGYDQDPAKKWPLVLFLHGSGEGESRESLRKHGPPKEVAAGRQFPFILVSPRSPPGSWQWWNVNQLGELLDDIEAKYRVDPDRVYVTGLSMGGYGTWRLASEFPNRFAAIAPFCGGWDEAEAPRIAHIPVWAFHGDKDPSVPVEYTLKMVAALKAAGGNPRMTIYPGVGHACWEEAYGGQEFYDWLLSQRRPAPKPGPQP